jgi:hypothetical protein
VFVVACDLDPDAPRTVSGVCRGRFHSTIFGDANMSTTQGVNRKSTTTEPSGEKITGSATTSSESGMDPIPAPEHLLARLANNPLDWLSGVAGKLGMPLLRTVLALVYVWFGVLKVIGHSDVYGLVSCRCWGRSNY